jgi:ATP-dependent protease ClpP protease subunit
MDFNYNGDDIYKSWINDSYNVFSKWSSHDFFSNKAQHIYFYEGVNDESVKNLQNLLSDASKNKVIDGVSQPPKPIVIHLKSPGGSVLSMNLFNVMLITVRVPLCVIVETLCASAATVIALLAPYRLMIDYSTYLIHDMSGGSFGKGNEEISANFNYLYQWNKNYITLLQDRTKLTKDDIKKFIRRDVSLNSSYCLKNGIVDRILKFPQINTDKSYDKNEYPNINLKLPVFLKKTNLNHLYIDSKGIYGDFGVVNSEFAQPLTNAIGLTSICVSLDTHILQSSNILQPLLIHFKPSVSSYMSTESNPMGIISLLYRIALIQTKLPVVAMIEGQQTLDNLSAVMMCPIRLMMTPSIISSYFSFSSSGSIGWGWKTIDIIHNTKFILNETIRFFRRFSKMPSKFYDDMQEKIINITPEESLKHNIIHQIINFRKTTPITIENIQDYYQLNNVISDDSLKESPKFSHKKKNFKHKSKSNHKSKSKHK